MIMDASKVRPPSFIQFATVNDFDTIITDYDPDGVLARAIADNGAPARLIEAKPERSARESVRTDSSESFAIGRQVDGHVGRVM